MKKRLSTKTSGVVLGAAGVVLSIILLSAPAAQAAANSGRPVQSGQTEPAPPTPIASTQPPTTSPPLTPTGQPPTSEGSPPQAASADPRTAKALPKCPALKPAGSAKEQQAVAAAAQASHTPMEICESSVRPTDGKARDAARRPNGNVAASDVTIGSYPVEPSCGTSTFSIHYEQTCAEGEFLSTFVITNVRTGAVAGTVDVGIDMSSHWSLSNTQVTDEYFTTYLTSTGAGNGPWTSGGGKLGCAPNNPVVLRCSVSAASFPFATVDAVPGSVTHIKAYRTWAMPVASGGDSLVAHSSYELWTYRGTLPIVNPSFRLPTSTVDSFVTYCDNAVGGRRPVAGCKAPTDRWAPTVSFSLLKYPYIGAADRQAQNAGAPGAPSSGRTLTRTTNPNPEGEQQRGV